MGDGTDPPQPVKSYPPPGMMMIAPPPPSPPRLLDLITAAADATAGFLGCCEVAGILALLSLIFGFWDFFQNRGHHHHQQQQQDAGSPAAGGSTETQPGRSPNQPGYTP